MTAWLLGRFIVPACDEYVYERYSKYGLALDYPSPMIIAEQGIWWQGTASDISGLLQFRYGASPYETIGVLWDTAESYPDPAAFLDEFSAVLASLGTEVIYGGPLVTSTKDDHQMVYQYFNVTERGILYTGVTGC